MLLGGAFELCSSSSLQGIAQTSLALLLLRSSVLHGAKEQNDMSLMAVNDDN